MKKLSEETLKTAVAEVVTAGNPYKEKSIQYFIDKQPRFIYHNLVYTAEALDQIYKNTVKIDVEKGYADRMVGYYDKWYRYSREDNGKAYDKGVELATKEDECSEEVTFIPSLGGVLNDYSK
jgi:hypothetical protein